MYILIHFTFDERNCIGVKTLCIGAVSYVKIRKRPSARYTWIQVKGDEGILVGLWLESPSVTGEIRYRDTTTTRRFVARLYVLSPRLRYASYRHLLNTPIANNPACSAYARFLPQYTSSFMQAMAEIGADIIAGLYVLYIKTHPCLYDYNWPENSRNYITEKARGQLAQLEVWNFCWYFIQTKLYTQG